MRFCRPLAAILLLLPLSANAQSPEGCDIIPLPRNNAVQVGDAVYIGGRTEFRCSGGVTFVSDSAVRAMGMRMLIGNVVFSDSSKHILTQRLDYHERAGTISAQGNTTVTDRKTASVLRAPTGLLYTREAPGKPARVDVMSGRPHLTVIDSAKAGQPPDTTNIHADAMTIIGQNHFTGRGNVVILRGALNASAAQTVFDDSLGIMQLWGLAHIKADTYDVRGDSIYAEVEGDEFHELRVFRNARIVSEDLDVKGARLNIAFDSGTVNRLIAVGVKGDVSTAVQAEAIAPDFTLKADSIDALAPKQKLEKVTAVGRAFGVRAPDSLDLKLPEAIRSDWLRGDTVIAYFTETADSIKARRPKSDSTNDRVLERLIAIGGTGKPATATYRMRPAGDTTSSSVEVGYIAARRIIAVFKDGAVFDLDAEGEVQGLYLQPIRREPTAGAQAVPASGKPTR